MSQEGSKPEKLIANFVKKLTEILKNPALASSVIWKNDGYGFMILDQNKFTSKVLPVYYRHRNMTSFVRQLNMYGFHKIKESDHSFYYHPYFKKYQEENYHLISRKPQKKIGNLVDAKNNVLEKEKQNNCAQEVEKVKNGRNKQRKVTFFEGITIEKRHKDTNEQKMMSNFTIKEPKSNIFNFEENEDESYSYHYREDDNVSISNLLEEKQKAKEFIRSSHKIIYWRQQNLSELNLNIPSEKSMQ